MVFKINKLREPSVFGTLLNTDIIGRNQDEW